MPSSCGVRCVLRRAPILAVSRESHRGLQRRVEAGGVEGLPARGSSDWSDHDQPDAGVEDPEVIGVGGDDPLGCSTGAHHHVGIDDIGGTAGGEETADVDGVDAIELDHIARRLADQPSKACLSFGSADCLGER